MIHSEDGATPLLSPALRYLPSHSSSYRTIPSVPLPSRRFDCSRSVLWLELLTNSRQLPTDLVQIWILNMFRIYPVELSCIGGVKLWTPAQFRIATGTRILRTGSRLPTVRWTAFTVTPPTRRNSTLLWRNLLRLVAILTNCHQLNSPCRHRRDETGISWADHRSNLVWSVSRGDH